MSYRRQNDLPKVVKVVAVYLLNNCSVHLLKVYTMFTELNY